MDRVLVVKAILLLSSLTIAVDLCYKACETRQRRLAESVYGSSHRLLTIQRLLRVSKRRKDCQLRERPGRIAVWWENFKNGLVSPEEWNDKFRTSKESFDELCFLIKPFIENQNTHLRKSISI